MAAFAARFRTVEASPESNIRDSSRAKVRYTYDHNGNRLTQSVNGSQTQSFTYNGHDVLVHGTAGNETPGYDYNGNETSNSISGTTYSSTFDDEDRLIKTASTSGPTDTYVYNGLGLRVGKTDSTGTYSYVCDGASPGSPVLSDGHAVYTPGLSENRGGVSSYPASDVLGNLWFMDNGAGAQSYYQDTTAFGTPTAIGGTSASPFKFGGANGCQTDADTGLVLMGHRYYDTRLGRFLSQDPAEAGGNWYAYAGNDPMDETDPTGLENSASGQPPGNYVYGPDSYTPGQAYTVNQDGSISTTMRGIAIPSGSGGSDPGLFDGVGQAFGVGVSAVGSQFSFGLWDGGPAKNNPSFGVSSGLAMAGTMLLPVGGEAKGAEVALTEAHLGVKGLQELRGTFSVVGKKATAKILMIRGEIKNPFGVIKTLSNVAREQGATSLSIEARLANERLYDILVGRYGLESEGGSDVINIHL